MKLWLIFFFVTCSLFGQRTKEGLFALRPTPQYTYPAKTDKDLAKIFHIKLWGASKLLCFDRHYVGVDFRYFIGYTTWFNKFRGKYFPSYIDQAFDCDNFAFLYKDLMISSAFKKSYKLQQILVGVVVVDSINEFHGIGGTGGNHALNIIHTSAGWYIVEPQNGKHTPYEKYTNPILKYIF